MFGTNFLKTPLIGAFTHGIGCTFIDSFAEMTTQVSAVFEKFGLSNTVKKFVNSAEILVTFLATANAKRHRPFVVLAIMSITTDHVLRTPSKFNTYRKLTYWLGFFLCGKKLFFRIHLLNDTCVINQPGWCAAFWGCFSQLLFMLFTNSVSSVGYFKAAVC